MTVRILPRYQISTLTTIGIGKVAIAVGDRVPVPGGERGDTGDLPATENLVSRAGRSPPQPQPAANRENPNVGAHPTLADAAFRGPARALREVAKTAQPALV